MADGKSGSRHAGVIDPYGSAQDANACPRSLRWFALIEGRVIPWQSSTTLIIVIVVIVLAAAIAVVGYQVAQQKRSVRLREQYGPEYDRPWIRRIANVTRRLSCGSVPSGTKSWSCVAWTLLSVRISSAGGRRCRASSWTIPVMRCGMLTCWWWR